MMRSVAIGWIVCAAASSAALAADVGGIKLDDKTSVGGQELVLNGAGIRTRAMFKVYVGSLYLPAKATTVDAALAKGPRRLQMDLVSDLSSDQLSDECYERLTETTAQADSKAIK